MESTPKRKTKKNAEAEAQILFGTATQEPLQPDSEQPQEQDEQEPLFTNGNAGCAEIAQTDEPQTAIELENVQEQPQEQFALGEALEEFQEQEQLQEAQEPQADIEAENAQEEPQQVFRAFLVDSVGIAVVRNITGNPFSLSALHLGIRDSVIAQPLMPIAIPENYARMLIYQGFFEKLECTLFGQANDTQ